LVWLLCGLAITSALAPALSNALQSLSNFRVMAISGVVPTFIRLLALCLLMPAFGITGFFGAQFLMALLAIAISSWGLRKVLSSTVTRESYRSNLKEMGWYTLPVFILMMAGGLHSTCETVVIRHALPDVESAAYYMISRFAEIPISVWGAISLVFFSLVSERHEQGKNSDRLLLHTMTVTWVAEGVIGLGLVFGAHSLLGLVDSWRVYQPYSWLIWILVLRTVCFQTASCFIIHEMACRRFGFVKLVAPLQLIEACLLYALTHIGFFRPYLPASYWNVLSAIPACHLAFIVSIMLGLAAVQLGGILVILWRRHPTKIQACAASPAL